MDGTYQVTVNAMDTDEMSSAPVSLLLPIHVTEQQGDVLAVGGRDDDDTFQLIPTVDGNVDVKRGAATLGTFPTGKFFFYGGAGLDSFAVNGTSADDTFALSADGVSFQGVTASGDSIESLTVAGLAGHDHFALAAGASFPGTLDGGDGTDVLDYSAFDAAVTVHLQAGTATGVAGFANMEVLDGSSAADQLLGPDVASTWEVNSTDAGHVGTFSFTAVESLFGGAADDQFRLQNGQGAAGVIDGGGGVNWLDYSAYTTGVAVDLALGTATAAAGGIANIRHIKGGSGNDTLRGNELANYLFAGAGDDVLFGGLSGYDVLGGGAGNDNLTAGTERSLLIGGLGADTVRGGPSDDLIIGGTTSHEDNLAALDAIMAEWTRTDKGYAKRVKHLRTKGTGLNGTFVLNAGTVKDDAAMDSLTGALGRDWFFGKKAEIKDRVTGEARG
jgi:Ca2+-binding RTX toxin-like protein